MRKLYYLFVIALLSSVAANAQATGGDVKKIMDMNEKKDITTTNRDTLAWVHGGVFNFGINEGFLHNWSAGGEVASLAINSLFSGHLDRLMDRQIWSNNLDLAYGLNYAFSQSFIPHKTDDRIDFTSKYGIKIDSSKSFYFTGIFNFKSQFTKGYDYTNPYWDTFSTSKFLSPAYFTTALGLEYRKGTDVSLFFSPIAGKLTIASRYYTDKTPQGAFGIDSGKTTKYEFGAYFSGRYQINIKKGMIFKTRLDLYANYLAKDVKNSEGIVVRQDNPGNIAVLWDNLFTWKISKPLNLTFGATFVYDNAIPYVKPTTPTDIPGNNMGWIQLKQIFTLGLEYKFN